MAGAQAAATWLTKHGGEELPHVRGQGQQPRVPGCIRAGAARGATLRLRSVAVGRRYPATEPSGGQEKTPRVLGQGQPGEVTLHPRPGVVTLRSHPKPEASGRSWEEPSTPEARAGGWEEQPEQWWLCRHKRA